ncbi:MAG: hypothetical protein ACP5IJ_01655 [Candidatus Nanoarchaeia archaeon]
MDQVDQINQEQANEQTNQAEQSEEKKILRRAPAIPVLIKNLTSEMGRVAVLGTIVGKNTEIGSVIIDDGEASILVLLNNPADCLKLKEGQIIRVLGKVWSSGNEIELLGEIVQDFSGIDLELYKKIFFKTK